MSCRFRLGLLLFGVLGITLLLAPHRGAASMHLAEVCQEIRPTAVFTPRRLDALYSEIAASAGTPPTAFEAEIERQVFALTNQLRAAKPGLRPFRRDPRFAEIARFHSRDMLARGYFSHVTPEGVDHATRISLGHRRFVGLSAENIFAVDVGTGDARDLARLAVKSWKVQPGHFWNMVNPSHTHLGVGVVRRGTCTLFTQKIGHYQATLRADIPFEFRRGQPISPRVVENLGISYGLARRGNPRLASGRYPLGPGALPAQPGVYVSRFFFPNGHQFLIYNGPMLKVR